MALAFLENEVWFAKMNPSRPSNSFSDFPPTLGITYNKWWDCWNHWTLRVWMPKGKLMLVVKWLENNYRSIWNKFQVTEIEFCPLVDAITKSEEEEVVFTVHFWYVPFPPTFGITYYQWWECWSHWTLRVWIPKGNIMPFTGWLEKNYQSIWDKYPITDIEFCPLRNAISKSDRVEVVFVVRFYYVPWEQLHCREL